MRSLLTVPEVRTLDVGSSLTAYADPLVSEAIADVSGMVEAFVGYELAYSAATTYEFESDGTDTIEFWGRLPLAATPTAITTELNTSIVYDMTKLVYWPETAPHDTLRYQYGPFGAPKDRVLITAAWGWETIPDAWKRAAFRLVRRYLTDEAFRGVYRGTASVVTSDQGAVRSISQGQTNMSVTFADAAIMEIGSRTLGDRQADKIFGALRRRKLGLIV